MRRTLPFFLAMVTTSAWLVAAPAQGLLPEQPPECPDAANFADKVRAFDTDRPFVPGELIVKFVGGNARAALKSLDDRFGATPLEHLDVTILRFEGDLRETAAELNCRTDVAWAEPAIPLYLSGHVVPTDPKYAANLQWAMENDGSRPDSIRDADVDAEGAWHVTTGSAAVRVAVIDTGVAYSHEDLAQNVSTGDGYDFVGLETDPAITPDGDAFDEHRHGHGTLVTGVIGARHNDRSIAGLNHAVTIVPIRAFKRSATTSSATIAQAIDHAIGKGVHVINASFGGYGPSEYNTFYDAICVRARDADILFVTSAGGHGAKGSDLDAAGNEVYPASLGKVCDNVVTVTASDDRDERLPGANYGGATVALMAPGADVMSTFACASPGTACHRSRTFWGTSAATAHVTGVAALVKAKNASRTYSEIRTILLESVDPVGVASETITGGRLNANAALAK